MVGFTLYVQYETLTICIFYLVVSAIAIGGEFVQILNCDNQHWVVMCLNHWGVKLEQSMYMIRT